MHFPIAEIVDLLDLIDPDISLYKTCKEIYRHIDIYYKKYEIDMNSNRKLLIRPIMINNKTGGVVNYIKTKIYRIRNFYSRRERFV